MRNRTINGTLLRGCRLAAGLRPAELAAAAQVSTTLIKYAESGGRQLGDVTARRVAHALGCRTDDFSHPKERCATPRRSAA